MRFKDCFWQHCMDHKKCLGICKGLDIQGEDADGNQCRDFAVFYDITSKVISS